MVFLWYYLENDQFKQRFAQRGEITPNFGTVIDSVNMKMKWDAGRRLPCECFIVIQTTVKEAWASGEKNHPKIYTEKKSHKNKNMRGLTITKKHIWNWFY